MLPTLLWRCPICRTHEALVHQERRFRHDLIHCTACQTRWELIRVVGGPDYRLRVLSGKEAGEERPLAEWYDLMMQDLALVPLEHPTWPLAGVSQPGEVLYLHCPQVRVLADPQDPIFAQSGAPQAAGAVTPFGLRPLGLGQLFFTSLRLLCLLADQRQLGLPWEELRLADTVVSRIFTAGFGDQMYLFLPQGQSPLKWLAHARLMAERVDPEGQRRIYLGDV